MIEVEITQVSTIFFDTDTVEFFGNIYNVSSYNTHIFRDITSNFDFLSVFRLGK